MCVYGIMSGDLSSVLNQQIIIIRERLAVTYIAYINYTKTKVAS